MSFDLDATRIVELLDELDRRLREVSVAASIYVVGGAAISLQLPDTGRRTQDIDVVMDDARVADLVAAMAEDLGLPDNWLNAAATSYVPGRPAGAATPPEAPGLRVVLASLQDLLAMKLAAGRARDRADTVRLAKALGVDDPETAVQVTVAAYGEEALEVFTTVEDVRHEAEALLGEHPPAQD